MTVCVLSDVHGNHLALKASLAYGEACGAEAYLFLGDYISDGAYPQKTLQALYEWAESHRCFFIRGNREEYMLEYRDGRAAGWQDGSATGSLLYTAENLTEKDFAWFATLENRCTVELAEGPPLLCCHGSPWKTTGTLAQGDPEVAARLRGLAEDFLVCGHTHRLGCYFLGAPPDGPKAVMRAGSVGYPLSTPGRAQVLLLRTADGMPRWRPEYALVPYDARAAVQEMYDCGLMRRAPVWSAMTAHALLTGENLAGLLPPYAQSLYEKDCGRKVPYGEIPEKYWQKAAEVYPCQSL